MKALYRKYRPTKLSEVIGEEQVTKALENSLKKGKISHSYLFTGPRGCGKTSVARIFAHEINGFKYELEDFYPDILEIDAASNTGVDNIRELRERAIIAPTEGKYKVYIIDEVHMLSKSAFNALLKTLEEPPAHVVFIMATTDIYKVPPTIISRSQIYEFQLANPDVMQKHLQSIAKKEKIQIDDDGLELIVRRGGGSFRDSISLLDQISTLSDQKITAELIATSLGLPEQTKIQNLITAYTAKNLGDISACLKVLLNSGVRAEIIAEEIIDYIVKSPSPELLPLLKPLTHVSAPFPEAKLLLSLTESLSAEQAGESDANFDGSHARPKQAGDPRGLFSGDARQAGEVDVNFEGRAERGSASISAETPVVTGVSDAGPKNSASPRQLAHEQNSASPRQSSTFNWDTFRSSVHTANPSISKILDQSTFRIEDGILKIITEKSFHKNVLLSKNNFSLLTKNLPEGLGLQIFNQKDEVFSTNDPQISKISDIMGGTVMEVNDEDGGNPF
ncbi:DNA polymerase III subunit gamma/tau [Candidatus Saccharibacteria bacterium]|nr:DNA polymerase III subunit gamma/tau [Candidatus Saccharibacteria bacterium]